MIDRVRVLYDVFLRIVQDAHIGRCMVAVGKGDRNPLFCDQTCHDAERLAFHGTASVFCKKPDSPAPKWGGSRFPYGFQEDDDLT